LYVAETVDAARALAASLPTPALLCGELGGLPPSGFDYGNSPTEMAGLALEGRPVVLATSNGTRALAALALAPAVLVGCFLNAAAVAQRGLALARALDADLTLVCSGDASGSQFSLEDALAAGYLVDRVRLQTGEGATVLDDGARAAWRLWQSYAATATPAAAAAQGF